MSRLEALEASQADPKAQPLLEAVRKKIGRVPNLMKTLAHSPVALEAYLGLSGTLDGALSASLREKIALATAGTNGCQYCASAHTAIGQSVGIDPDELTRNLGALSDDPTSAAALQFVRHVIDQRGKVTDEQLSAVRKAGFGDREIAEIVALIALNTFTNFFNGVARTDIDFPQVELVPACAC